MARQPKNAGQRWTDSDRRQLKSLAKENGPTRVIALRLGRTEADVRSQAQDQGVSLKPTNQSPNNRRTK
jgi:hypothetical protein